jgi:2-oxoglutarate/2-oxoacid ferredoxin oxidoreductase subunit alpha
MHRIGGIEKEDGSGNISYDPRTTSAWSGCGPKVAGIAPTSPPVEVDRRRRRRRVLVLGWGSTWGAITAGRRAGPGPRRRRSPTPTWHLNPFPRTSARCSPLPKVLVPEMNLGQLSRCCGPSSSSTPEVTKVNGLPFTAGRAGRAILESLND